MKLYYRHPTQKYVKFSAPKPQFDRYKDWLDFALSRYPVENWLGLNIRFQKRDHYSIAKGATIGYFSTKWKGEGDIAICTGKTQPISEEEIRSVFFHEYGHFLQHDQNRFYNIPYRELEADADSFAETAVIAYNNWLALSGPSQTPSTNSQQPPVLPV